MKRVVTVAAVAVLVGSHVAYGGMQLRYWAADWRLGNRSIPRGTGIFGLDVYGNFTESFATVSLQGGEYGTAEWSFPRFGGTCELGHWFVGRYVGGSVGYRAQGHYNPDSDLSSLLHGPTVGIRGSVPLTQDVKEGDFWALSVYYAFAYAPVTVLHHNSRQIDNDGQGVVLDGGMDFKHKGLTVRAGYRHDSTWDLGADDEVFTGVVLGIGF